MAQILIPADRLGVHPTDFVAYWDEAERQYERGPSRYLAGVVAAFRWTAGVLDTPPVSLEPAEATPERMALETQRATARTLGFDSAPGKPGWERVDPDWARGAMFTLAWVRGRTRAKPPIRMSSPDGQAPGWGANRT